MAFSLGLVSLESYRLPEIFTAFSLVTFLYFPVNSVIFRIYFKLKSYPLKLISKSLLSSGIKLWREMLFYCLDILLPSKDIKDLGILLIFFQNILLVVFDEFDGLVCCF